MKNLCALCLGMAFLFAGSAAAAENGNGAESSAEEAKKNMETVCGFLKEAGVYYLATVDGDQPRVRPFGTALIFEGRLYIQTGRKKNVSKQLARNGKVEICAFQPQKNRWLRLSGTLVDDSRREAKQAMLDAHPGLKKMYSADDPDTQVLYFAPGATATIDSFGSTQVVLKF